jgi:hypothetical protein
MKVVIALAIALGILWLVGVTVIAVWPVVGNAPWEDGDGGTAKPVAPIATGFEALSYKEKNDICHEFASLKLSGGGELTQYLKYKKCMECGPERVVGTAQADGSYTWSCQ